MDLSILIPTLKKRYNILYQILNEVKRQLKTVKFLWEIIIDCDEGEKTLGQKRNDLVKEAKGEYIIFLDDDDAIHPLFFQIYEPMFLTRDYDVGELYGLRYSDSKVDRPVHYSLPYAKYMVWYNDVTIYLRSPCHLTPMRTSLAKTIQWLNVTNGEDREFSKRLSKFMKQTNKQFKEFSLPDTTPLYHYLDNIKDKRQNILPVYDENVKQFIFIPNIPEEKDFIFIEKGIQIYDTNLNIKY